MGKRVRISNERLNSYGTRVLTAGMDTEQYRRNPVLLYMHERGNVIGYVKDLKTENGEVTGELMFDCASELSERCKRQFEFGSLRMVSAGLDIVEMSDKKELLVEGQTAPTITKSRLVEVSVADIGANDDALVLHRHGKTITLGREGGCPLPLLDNNNKQKDEKMENKTIALALGLKATATDAEISAKLTELQAAKAENETLKKEKDALALAQITTLVERAVNERRLTEENKDRFITLGKKIGAEELDKVLKAMSPQVKLSAVIGHQGGASKSGCGSYGKLSEVPEEQLLSLKKEDLDEYKRLYKAEYGIDMPE